MSWTSFSNRFVQNPPRNHLVKAMLDLYKGHIFQNYDKIPDVPRRDDGKPEAARGPDSSDQPTLELVGRLGLKRNEVSFCNLPKSAALFRIILGSTTGTEKLLMFIFVMRYFVNCDCGLSFSTFWNPILRSPRQRSSALT